MNKNEKCKPYKIKFNKYYNFWTHDYNDKLYVLNNNDIVIYGGKKLDVYTINLRTK